MNHDACTCPFPRDACPACDHVCRACRLGLRRERDAQLAKARAGLEEIPKRKFAHDMYDIAIQALASLDTPSPQDERFGSQPCGSKVATTQATNTGSPLPPADSWAVAGASPDPDPAGPTPDRWAGAIAGLKGAIAAADAVPAGPTPGIPLEGQIKTAREVAHEAMMFDCPAGGTHYYECDKFTAIIERDRASRGIPGRVRDDDDARRAVAGAMIDYRAAESPAAVFSELISGVLDFVEARIRALATEVKP